MSPRAGMILVNEIAPRLRASTRKLKKVGADDHGELYADGIAIAAGTPLHERVRERKAKIIEQRQRIQNYRAQISEQTEELRKLRRSASWKIGRMWTKPFRMFRAKENR